MNKNWLDSAGLNHFWMIWRYRFLLNELKRNNIKINRKIKIMDLGCGNGWVCRLLEQREECSHVVGVDGSEVMIEKAQTLGQGEFHLARLPEWRPEATFDFLHSMEFLYYLEDPAAMLKMIHAEWLNEGGCMVAGVDHYLENEDSHGWPEALDVHMTLLSEAQWKQAMIDAGFSDVGIQRVAAKDDFVGTLVMFGRKDSN